MYYLQASKALFKSLSDARKKVDMSYVERHPTDACLACYFDSFCAEHEKQYRPKPVVEEVPDHPYRGEQPKEYYGHCAVCQMALKTSCAYPYDEEERRHTYLCLKCIRVWVWHPPTKWEAFKHWVKR